LFLCVDESRKGSAQLTKSKQGGLGITVAPAAEGKDQ
jgi:hypothetical protein